MRKIVLIALMILTIYAIMLYWGQLNLFASNNNIDINKFVTNFITKKSFMDEAYTKNTISDDEKTVLPPSEVVKQPLKGNEDEKQIYDEETCKAIMLEYIKKGYYASIVTNYQSMGKGKIDSNEYFGFNFYRNTGDYNIYIITYYIDENFNMYYRDVFSGELRKAGEEEKYRSIMYDFNKTNSMDVDNILEQVNIKIGNEKKEIECKYGGNYNINGITMAYIYYYDNTNNLQEYYYDYKKNQLYYMTEILEPVLEN